MTNTIPQTTNEPPIAGTPLPKTTAETVTPPKPRSKKTLLLITGLALFILLAIALAAAFYPRLFSLLTPSTTSTATKPATESIPPQPTVPVHELIGSSTAPVRLTYAIHWTEPFQTDGIYENGQLKSKGLKQYLQEYVALYPEVAFQIQAINYGEYAAKLPLLAAAGTAPDIYQIYSPWGVSYVNQGLLDTPPAEVIADVKANYVSYKGATIDDQVWGFPTEVNTYALVYNKEIFKEAGITKPPKTFSELVDAAVATTKYDANGNIVRYGIAFLKGNDWQVVDPFLAWTFTNGGGYLSPDLSAALFNSPAAKQVLEGELQLFTRRATDNNGNFFNFKDGKVAMVISPPWLKAIFKAGFGDSFDSVVGVAPLPYFEKPATLQYSWFMGVMAQSKYRSQAWEFLKWFNTEVQASGTTRYGDLLADTIGAIPSRKIDLDRHQNVLADSFTKVFVDQIKSSVSEPNVANADQIKKLLMSQIEAAWSGQKSAAEALDAAAAAVNALLK